MSKADNKPSANAAKVGKTNKTAADSAKTSKITAPAAKADPKTAKADPKAAKAKNAKTSKASKNPNKKPNIFKRFITYLKNVRLEVKRTTWPTRNEVWRMSLIVVGALIFFGVTIFLLDTIMTQLLRLYAGLAPAGVGLQTPVALRNLLAGFVSLIR
ncbi:MAG: preprotein translocase subunit SecE [Actinomycetia bacterium]|nr:preprotein translocase subunit SecE [Actinomycetes bacterium]